MLFLGVVDEVRRLAEHWADTGNLEHQPLPADRALRRVARHKAAGLLGEVEQDRAGFPEHKVAAIWPLMVDYDRGLVVRVERQELRRQLIAGQDVDSLQRPRQAHLVQRDGDLPRIRRRAAIESDHPYRNSSPS